MSLKDTLKWMLVLFFVITTIQVFTLSTLMGPLMIDPMRTLSRPELSMRICSSLALLLPMLILLKRRPISSAADIWPWLRWRIVIHFFLTMGVLYVITASLDWSFFTWLPPALITYGVSALVITKFGLKNLILRKEKAEQEALHQYTEELEKQYTSMRKFEHDYQNILLSMRIYLDEGDLPGLKKYFTSKVEAASEVITKNHFALRHLDKIKVREIKSLLAAKLGLAQHSATEVFFDANETIDDFYINPVKLVRMLGIILDNAIDALTELGGGELWVGCFKEDGDILFIIRNTCRSDMPAPHQLEQQGFSTKGEGRGFGLHNLFEIAKSSPNVLLETKIIEDNFIQKLTITQDEGRA